MTQVGVNDLKTFVADTDAVAEEVNENFTVIKNAHNDTDTKLTTLLNNINSDNSDVKADGSTKLTQILKYQTFAVTGASYTIPITITATAHKLVTGNLVKIVGVLGDTGANGTFSITVIDENTFSLNGSVGNGIYTSGGTGYLLPQNNEDMPSLGYVQDLISNVPHPTFVPYAVNSGAVDAYGYPNIIQKIDNSNIKILASSVPLVLTYDNYQTETITADQNINLNVSSASPPTFSSMTTNSFTTIAGTDVRSGTSINIAGMTKTISPWTAGTSGGSLLDSALQADKLYYVFDLIPTSGTAGDIGISASPTPTPPNGYTASLNPNIYLYTNSGSTLVPMSYSSGTFTYTTAINDGTSSVLHVPPLQTGLLTLGVSSGESNGSSNLTVSSKVDNTSASVSCHNSDGSSANSTSASIIVDATSSVNVGVSSTGSNASANITVNGFTVGKSNTTTTLTIIKELGNNTFIATSANVSEDLVLPTSANNGDYFTIPNPLKSYKRINNIWVPTSYVKLSEVTITSGNMRTPISYMFNGKYISQEVACTAVSTQTTFYHNVGTTIIKPCTLFLKNYIAEANYSIGDIIEAETFPTSSTVMKMSPIINKNTVTFTTASCFAYYAVNKTTGAGTGLTSANWKQFVYIERNF